MIAKKTRSKKTKSKAAHVSDLIDYVCDAVDDAPRPRPERAQRPPPSQSTRRPKVLHVGAYGFVTRRRSGWKAEMVALAFEAPRSKNPFSHWILSWPKGEVPTARQFDEAVVLFLDELGLPEHQVVYAAHQDTENVHLHMVINRVHPDTVRVIKPNRGFDHEAGHRATAPPEPPSPITTATTGVRSAVLVMRCLQTGPLHAFPRRVRRRGSPVSALATSRCGRVSDRPSAFALRKPPHAWRRHRPGRTSTGSWRRSGSSTDGRAAAACWSLAGLS